MTSITSIPTTRVSDAFFRRRLLNQVRMDESHLFRIQAQISTGRRFELGSQDAPAARRAMGLQTLLERKTQIRVNLQITQSFLSASDVALGGVSSLLAEARGLAMSASTTTSSVEAREAAAAQIDRILQQIVDAGNQQFRDRYLFAGSTTQAPFVNSGMSVEFRGNELSLPIFGDLDLLLNATLRADSIFGGFSGTAYGTQDLNPVLTENTPLRDLRGGQGITPGSIAISNGMQTSVIDVSRAETIGDVARLLENNPPPGSKITAYVAHDGLRISIDSGALTIREVAGGTTVNELGILAEQAVPSIAGRDLQPILKPTTPLDSILGVKARGRYLSTDNQAGIELQARRPGPEFNDFTLELVPGGVAGAESVTYDPDNKLIQVQIQAGQSRADQVLAALNNSAAAADFSFRSLPGSNGSGPIDVGTVTTAGGSGHAFDQASGLRIVNGGKTTVVGFASATTIEDVLNVLNGSGAGVHASINASGTGIDIRSRLSGVDFSIGENGGATAAHLGVRTFHLETPLSDLNHGLGVHTSDQGADFIVRRRDGVQLAVDLDAASAAARLGSSADNNGLVIAAMPPGPHGNAYSVQIVDGGTGAAPSLTLQGQTLQISADLSAGFSAQQAVELVNQSSLAAQFSARLDAYGESGNDGAGHLAAMAPVALTGGAGKAQTVGDVLARINQHPENVGPGAVVARLALVGNGIELVDDNLTGGHALAVLRANQSQAGEDLGFLSFQQAINAGSTPGGAAMAAVNSPGGDNALLFRTRIAGEAGNAYQVEIVDSGAGGATSVVLSGDTLRFSADLAAGFTAQDAIDLLQAHPSLGQHFEALLDLAADPNNDGSGNLAATAPVSFAGGQSSTLKAVESNPQEVAGIFTALIRLRDAMREGDLVGISRATQLLDAASETMNFARAELGARQQSVDILIERIDVEEIQLRESLSLEMDVDLVQAISDLTARQASYEAALRSLGQTLQLTLLNFL